MKSNISFQPHIETYNFKVYAQGMAAIDKMPPDQRSIKLVLKYTKRKYLQENLIVIARNHWLKRHKLSFPDGDRLFNLCVQIRDGKVIRSFYSETMQHLLKKLNYRLIILN